MLENNVYDGKKNIIVLYVSSQLVDHVSYLRNNYVNNYMLPLKMEKNKNKEKFKTVNKKETVFFSNL